MESKLGAIGLCCGVALGLFSSMGWSAGPAPTAATLGQSATNIEPHTYLLSQEVASTGSAPIVSIYLLDEPSNTVAVVSRRPGPTTAKIIQMVVLPQPYGGPHEIYLLDEAGSLFASDPSHPSGYFRVPGQFSAIAQLSDDTLIAASDVSHSLVRIFGASAHPLLSSGAIFGSAPPQTIRAIQLLGHNQVVLATDQAVMMRPLSSNAQANVDIPLTQLDINGVGNDYLYATRVSSIVANTDSIWVRARLAEVTHRRVLSREHAFLIHLQSLSQARGTVYGHSAVTLNNNDLLLDCAPNTGALFWASSHNGDLIWDPGIHSGTTHILASQWFHPANLATWTGLSSPPKPSSLLSFVVSYNQSANPHFARVTTPALVGPITMFATRYNRNRVAGLGGSPTGPALASATSVAIRPTAPPPEGPSAGPEQIVERTSPRGLAAVAASMNAEIERARQNSREPQSLEDFQALAAREFSEFSERTATLRQLISALDGSRSYRYYVLDLSQETLHSLGLAKQAGWFREAPGRSLDEMINVDLTFAALNQALARRLCESHLTGSKR